MYHNTIQNWSLAFFILVFSLILPVNESARAQTIPKPLKYLEGVTFYDKSGRSGQFDDLPERLDYNETFVDENEYYKYTHTVNQQGYVSTLLASFGASNFKRIPLVKISDMVTVTVSSSGSTYLNVRTTQTYGAIYLYAEITNTSGVKRQVPIQMDGLCVIDIVPMGRALGIALVDLSVRALNRDYTYKSGYIFNKRYSFCNCIGDVLGRDCSGGYYAPGLMDIQENCSIEVASGVIQPIEIKIQVRYGPDILASTSGNKGSDTSSAYFYAQVDPFIYIDPKWEYADGYTLKLSPGAYAGPKYDLVEIVSALKMLAGMKISLGDLWLNDISGDDRIGLEEVIYMLQRVSLLR
ncbi:MAG: hypothetical protein JXA41_06030 [Deltaproteobacteria bacterium]|nr:hypothetical protein [Deltaproteobacteria bacterium]